MGQPTGFIEYLRESPADRPPLERLRDWPELLAKEPALQLVRDIN